MRGASAVALLAAILPVLRVDAVSTVSSADGERYGAIISEPYSAAALEDYRRAGVPVFIDFTAAWCVTCQFDKINIFSNKEVAAAFEEKEIVFMVADWTVRDPAITAKLSEFGASGVPFYLYYRENEEAEVFDIPLTRKAVLSAIAP